jgi:dynein regulatory complex protein 1
MHCRYYELKQCFDQNLEEIESVASEERKELLMKNGAQMQKLFDLFSKMEQNHVEERQKRVEQQQNDLAQLRLHDAEDYTSLKARLHARGAAAHATARSYRVRTQVRLESDVQKLEQQLEEMRATYQLNTEKLEYNFTVLTARDVENSATIQQQKRKLARLQDVLSQIMSRYHASDKK